MSTSAQVTSTPAYDVFISHRGVDMKKKFANCLYRVLSDRGINAFLDISELEKHAKEEDIREPMMEAVRSAKFNIPIFTEDYGTSEWCLTELAEMMQREQNNQTKVIPIYYNLKPEDLRTGKGEFASRLEGFLNEHKFDVEKVNGWKHALEKASWFGGFRLEKYNGLEGDLIYDVVAKIQQEIDESRQVEMPVPFAVGLGRKVEKVGKLMQLHDDTIVYVLLLWGLGGMGKTTLARAVYNRYGKEFQERSFVEGCASQKPIDVQDHLRKVLLKYDKDLEGDLARGRECLYDGVRKKKALIVLDDVKDFDSVRMVIDIKRLCPGSRILLTSRDAKAYPHAPDFQGGRYYKVGEMDKEESLRLFCLHAFGKPFPNPEFHTVAERVVKECGGAPLALKVLGEHLGSVQGIEQWEEAVDMLRYSDFGEISNTWEISYNALDDYEKEMFQDVACFLAGELESEAMCYWENSIRSCKTRFTKLTQRGLVEVNEEQLLTMHDLLKDFGRKMGRVNKTRVCDDDELLRLLNYGEDLHKIRGLVTSRAFLDASTLCRMPNLQLLFLKGTRLKDLRDEFDCLKLVWLRWRCPDNFPTLVRGTSPPKLALENLSLLDVRWPDNILGLRLPEHRRLKIMFRPCITKLSDSVQRKVRSSGSLWEGLGYCENMEVLKLGGFDDIVELPFSFGQLRSLENLSITACSKLRKLPSSLGELKKLRRMDIDSCFRLEGLPPNFGGLENLETCNLIDTLISKLPSSFEDLKNLRYLNLGSSFGCGLKELPQNFGSLKYLCDLNISGCGLKELPQSFGSMKNLRYLDISLCEELKELPQNFGGLESLEELIASGSSITKFPCSFGDLKNLRHLDISFCRELKELPQNIVDLESLEILNLHETSLVNEVPSSFREPKKRGYFISNRRREESPFSVWNEEMALAWKYESYRHRKPMNSLDFLESWKKGAASQEVEESALYL